MLVRGAEPMENASNAAFLRFWLLLAFAHMFFLRYPLILWITVLPPLSELIPLAAAERPSAASQ
jgi:hypothetical protein